MHFRDHFAPLPDLPIQGSLSFLADLPHIQEVETAYCKRLVTEYDVCDALKRP